MWQAIVEFTLRLLRGRRERAEAVFSGYDELTRHLLDRMKRLETTNEELFARTARCETARRLMGRAIGRLKAQVRDLQAQLREQKPS